MTTGPGGRHSTPRDGREVRLLGRTWWKQKVNETTGARPCETLLLELRDRRLISEREKELQEGCEQRSDMKDT